MGVFSTRVETLQTPVTVNSHIHTKGRYFWCFRRVTGAEIWYGAFLPPKELQTEEELNGETCVGFREMASLLSAF